MLAASRERPRRSPVRGRAPPGGWVSGRAARGKQRERALLQLWRARSSEDGGLQASSLRRWPSAPSASSDGWGASWDARHAFEEAGRTCRRRADLAASAGGDAAPRQRDLRLLVAVPAQPQVAQSRRPMTCACCKLLLPELAAKTAVAAGVRDHRAVASMRCTTAAAGAEAAIGLAVWRAGPHESRGSSARIACGAQSLLHSQAMLCPSSMAVGANSRMFAGGDRCAPESVPGLLSAGPDAARRRCRSLRSWREFDFPRQLLTGFPAGADGRSRLPASAGAVNGGGVAGSPALMPRSFVFGARCSNGVPDDRCFAVAAAHGSRCSRGSRSVRWRASNARPARPLVVAGLISMFRSRDDSRQSHQLALGQVGEVGRASLPDSLRLRGNATSTNGWKWRRRKTNWLFHRMFGAFRSGKGGGLASAGAASSLVWPLPANAAGCRPATADGITGERLDAIVRRHFDGGMAVNQGGGVPQNWRQREPS
ncbi:hypothetical protein FQR65_LT20182 [Abscondita terminalis]|nr:hypothetical protein FQR65_LT20182 [Abscondita terminalis]